MTNEQNWFNEQVNSLANKTADKIISAVLDEGLCPYCNKGYNLRNIEMKQLIFPSITKVFEYLNPIICNNCFGFGTQLPKSLHNTINFLRKHRGCHVCESRGFIPAEGYKIYCSNCEAYGFVFGDKIKKGLYNAEANPYLAKDHMADASLTYLSYLPIKLQNMDIATTKFTEKNIYCGFPPETIKKGQELQSEGFILVFVTDLMSGLDAGDQILLIHEIRAKIEEAGIFRYMVVNAQLKAICEINCSTEEGFWEFQTHYNSRGNASDTVSTNNKEGNDHET